MTTPAEVFSFSEVSEVVGGFLKLHGIHRVVAFCGGADDELPGIDDDKLKAQYKELTEQRQTHVVEEIVAMLSGYRVAILTGGTKWGIPKVATLTARRYGLKTIGIYPTTARSKALADYLDLAVEVPPLWPPSRWGDESPLIASLLDGAIVYGGGAGTLVEIAHVLKMNEKLFSSGLPVKYIIPISTTGGVADGLPFIWAKHEVRTRSMPSKRVVSGREAAELLIDRLSLEDYSTLDEEEL